MKHLYESLVITFPSKRWLAGYLPQTIKEGYVSRKVDSERTKLLRHVLLICSGSLVDKAMFSRFDGNHWMMEFR